MIDSFYLVFIQRIHNDKIHQMTSQYFSTKTGSSISSSSKCYWRLNVWHSFQISQLRKEERVVCTVLWNWKKNMQFAYIRIFLLLWRIFISLNYRAISAIKYCYIFPYIEHRGICQVPVQILLLLHYWNVYGFRFVYIWGNSLQSSPTFT